MTYTIGKLGPRHFFSLVLYFDLGARIFSTQRPPYDVKILQGLLYLDKIQLKRINIL